MKGVTALPRVECAKEGTTMVIRKFGVFMLGLGMLAGSARATTTYTTAPALITDATTAGLTLSTAITFGSDTCSLCVSVTDSGITFTGPQMNIETWSGGSLLEPSTAKSSVSISQVGDYYAFALNLVTISGAGFPIDIEFNDGTSHDFTVTAASAGTAVFFGDISTAPITSLQIVSNFNQLNFGIDNVQFGGAAPTPDGPTLVLIGPGLIALSLLYRRRRQRRGN
jgi:hypothetical protein